MTDQKYAQQIANMRGLMQPTPGARTQALADFFGELGAGLLQGGAPSPMPGGFQRGLASGIREGNRAYSQRLDAARKRNLGGLQLQMALNAEARRKAAEERAAAGEARGIEKWGMEKSAAERALQSQNQLNYYLTHGGVDEITGQDLPMHPTIAKMRLEAHFDKMSKYPPAGKDLRTKIMKNAEALGLEPGTEPYRSFIKSQTDKAGMKIYMQGDGTGASKGVLESYNAAYVDRLPKRRERLRGLTRMLELSKDVDSGAWAEQKLALSKIGVALGMGGDLNKIASAEEFGSQAMARMLELIQLTKGAISEKEMDAFGKASAGLKNSKAGNALILKFAIEGERREERLDQLRVDLVQKNPKINKFELDAQVDLARRNMRNQSFLSPRELSELEELGIGRSSPRASIWRSKTTAELLAITGDQ